MYARWMLRAAGRVASRIFTVSEYSKSDLVRYLKVSPQNISVIYPGVDESFRVEQDAELLTGIRRNLGITGDYILYTGIFKQRKNHIGLLNAFALLLAGGVRAQLVIAGPLGEGEQILRDKADELGIAGQVIFAGFVSECDLPTLYSAARVYACPSLYEGFGFTVLEAMACGVPVVCHNETSLPEVVGDAAYFANAGDAEQFALALRQVMEDTQLRDDLVQRGFKNVRRFSWTRAAGQSLDAYERILYDAAPAETAPVAASTYRRITTNEQVQKSSDDIQQILVD
jgi:glycosyltransferase involved in cell wall biosynthesis